MPQMPRKDNLPRQNEPNSKQPRPERYPAQYPGACPLPGQYPVRQQQPTSAYQRGYPQSWQTPQGGESAYRPPKPPKEQKPPRDWGELFGRGFTILLVFFVLGYLGWLYAPRVRNAMTFWPTATPHPVTPSPTPVSSATITPLASNTPTPAPTATPGPLSAFWEADGNAVEPSVPDAPDGVIVLHVDQSAEVNPALDSNVWTSSEKIAADLGKTTYQENWFATYSSGWVRWFMDQPLREGLYEIYTMDTMYSSGGELDFSVILGDQNLTPLSGTQHIDYMTSQYDPIQGADTWRSIGMYFIGPSNDVLTVTTSWKDRDQYTIVALDRLLIVPRRITNLNLLNQLPQNTVRFVVDNRRMQIGGSDFILPQSAEPAWDDSYDLIINPKEKVTITLPAVEPWPIGNYKVYAWMPKTRGGITASAQLFADNALLNTDAGEESASITSPENEPGMWVEIGSWTTDRYYERPRKFKFLIAIAAVSTGEFPVDALAFIHTPF